MLLHIQRLFSHTKFTGMLAALLLCVLPATSGAQTSTVKVSGTGSGTGGMQLLAEPFAKSNPNLALTVLPALGSSGGIAALIAGRVEVAIANRLPNDKERAEAKLEAREYARTPFVLAVHKGIGLSQISHATLAAVYAEPTTMITPTQRARPILRLADATDTNLIKSMHPDVSKGVEIASQRRGMLSANTDTETADLIEKTPGGIGPSTLAQILSEKRPLVALTIENQVPSVEQFNKGGYLYFKSLYVITRADAAPATKAFLKFLDSTEARAMLSAHGHAMR